MFIFIRIAEKYAIFIIIRSDVPDIYEFYFLRVYKDDYTKNMLLYNNLSTLLIYILLYKRTNYKMVQNIQYRSLRIIFVLND